MNRTLFEIINSREDLSNYLFHFTKGRKAKDTLMNIINDKAIKDVSQIGHICFSDAPVTMLAPMFAIFSRYSEPMYAPYGIGVRKDVIYKQGGRPVIYGDENDRRILPQEMKWRFELFHPEQHDFTWLREWRLPKAVLELSFDNCFIILNSNKDSEELWNMINTIDVDVDAQPEDGGILTDYNICLTKRYRVVSMEDISTICMMNKKTLQKELSKQTEEEYLQGSAWE